MGQQVMTTVWNGVIIITVAVQALLFIKIFVASRVMIVRMISGMPTVLIFYLK